MKTASVLLATGVLILSGCSSDGPTPEPSPTAPVSPPVPAEDQQIEVGSWGAVFCDQLHPLLADNQPFDARDVTQTLEGLGAPEGHADTYDAAVQAAQNAVVEGTEQAERDAVAAIEELLAAPQIAAATSSCSGEGAPGMTSGTPEAAATAANELYVQMIELYDGGTLRDQQLLMQAITALGQPIGVAPIGDFEANGNIEVLLNDARACMTLPNTPDEGPAEVVEGPCST